MSWKMSSNVSKIPLKNHSISNSDAGKLVFPLMAENIMEIFLSNQNNNTIIPYYDERLYNANETRAKEGDIITMSFIPSVCKNVLVKLVAKDIHSYSGGLLNDTERLRHSLGSAKIAITTGGNTLLHTSCKVSHFSALERTSIYIC